MHPERLKRFKSIQEREAAAAPVKDEAPPAKAKVPKRKTTRKKASTASK